MNKTFSVRLGVLKIKSTAAALISLVILEGVLISLGLWQLQRAEEKKLMEQQDAALNVSEARPLDTVSVPKTNDGNPIKVAFSGRYLNDQTFFIANQVFQKQVGYEAITPVELGPKQQWVLVSRGWLSPQGLERYPELTLEGKQNFEGVLYAPAPPERFEPYIHTDDDLPLRVRRLNLPAAQQWLGHPLYPAVVRLAPDQPGVLLRHWPTVQMVDSPHLSYAIQWFGIAMGLLAVALFRSSNLSQLVRGKPH